MGIIGNKMAIPLDTNGSIPMNKTPRLARPFNFYFVQAIQPLSSLSTSSTAGTRQITITPGSGVGVGNYIGLFSGNSWYFGTALVVSGDALVTLDTPLDFAFPTGTTVLIASRDLNVDGATVPEIFSIGPVFAFQQNVIEVSAITLSLTDNSPMDNATFGGIGGGLANGLVARSSYLSGTIHNQFNVHNNGEFFDFTPWVNYASKAPAGQYGLNVVIPFGGENNRNAIIDLGVGDTLDLVVQDDLSPLLSMRAMAFGSLRVN